MLCLKHPTPLNHFAQILVRPCCECGNLTYADCEICAHCSKGYNQCQRCRATLENSVDPRKIAAFNSPRAYEIRKNQLHAREVFAQKKRDAETTYAVCTAEYRNLAREQIAPLRAACEKACKPHRDKLTAVSERLAGDVMDSSLLSLTSIVIHPRLKEAMEQCDAACLSIQDKYERDIWGFLQSCREAIKPSQSELKWTVNRAQDQLNQQLRSLDHQLETLLYRSTRFRWIVLGIIGEIAQKFLRQLSIVA